MLLILVWKHNIVVEKPSTTKQWNLHTFYTNKLKETLPFQAENKNIHLCTRVWACIKQANNNIMGIINYQYLDSKHWNAVFMSNLKPLKSCYLIIRLYNPHFSREIFSYTPLCVSYIYPLLYLSISIWAPPVN